jgi:hypothetical protein
MKRRMVRDNCIRPSSRRSSINATETESFIKRSAILAE